MQINPDRSTCLRRKVGAVAFQSYQFMQINPDAIDLMLIGLHPVVVSIVSIHADQSRRWIRIPFKHA